MSETLVKRRWRLRFRLGARSTIALILVIGAVGGLYLRSVRIQEKAAAAIERGGGSVGYYWERDWDAGSLSYEEPFWRRWPARLLGFGFVTHPDNITLSTDKLTAKADEIMPAVGELTSLRALTIRTPTLTDAGLQPLERLQNLITLSLSETSIHNNGLSRVKPLGSLEFLAIEFAPIDDDGLVFLKDLTKLKRLSLNGSKVGDRGISQLSGLKQLAYLCLSDTNVGDAGLSRLKGLTALQSIELMGTPITDSGIASLKSLTSLHTLMLGRTGLTDAAFEHLKGFPALASLDLPEGRITEAGILAFRKSRPDVIINGHNSPIPGVETQ